MNVVVLQGSLCRPPEVRELADGSRLVSLDLSTETVAGRLMVPVSWSADEARLPEAGTELVVTGQVRRRFFRVGGATQSRTEVVADAVVPARAKARARRAVEHALAAAREAGS